MVSDNLYVIMLWIKIVLALEGLMKMTSYLDIHLSPKRHFVASHLQQSDVARLAHVDVESWIIMSEQKKIRN